MADHVIAKFWGLSGALMTALLTLALIVPAGAEAVGPGSGALSQLAAVVPAPAQSAVSAALAQVPSASGAGASGVAQPESPPSVPVVVPTPPPVHIPPPPPVHMPVVARPTPAPAPANPAPSIPVPAPWVDGQTVSAAAPSVPQPDALMQAAHAGSNQPGAVRGDVPTGGQAPARRIAHPRAHRHQDSLTSVSTAWTRRAPVARFTAARPWSPVPVLETSRRGTQPAAPARRADSRSETGHRRHLVPQRSRQGFAVTTAPLAVPLSAAPPPGGADGSAAGAGGGAAGAAAAALLSLFGLCILRALLPGLLGLGLAPARSAFLVSRLERPG